MGLRGQTRTARTRACAVLISLLRSKRLEAAWIAALSVAVAPCQGRSEVVRPAGILTTVGAIQSLPPATARMALPVDVTATVEYYEAKRLRLFISDPTGGVYVSLASTDELPMKRGDLIEVQGVTDASFRSRVAHARIKMLGRKGTLARPSEEGFRALMSGKFDCRSVSIRGVVRSASPKEGSAVNMAQLMIQIPGGTVRVYIEDARGVDLEGIIDSEVQVDGIAGGIFNGRFQLMQTVLYSTDPSQLKVIRPALVNPRKLPYTAIDDVLSTRYVDDQTQRVRVQGAVTFYQPAHMIVIQNNGESLLANTHEVKPIALGQVVDLTGFADGNGSGPMLDEAHIFPTGKFETVTPRPVSYEDAIGGLYSDGLVTLEGEVLSQLHEEVSDSMVLMVNQHPVNVLLWTGNRPQMQPLPEGTLVKVTGICHITKTDPWGNSVSFLLEMREPGDVKVLGAASWWTVMHLLLLLLAALAVSLMVTAWALALRRRVAAQAGRIQQSMVVERERGRLLEAINSQTPLPELMEDICGSFEKLVPGVQCSYELLESCCDLDEDWTVEQRSEDPGVSRSSVDVRRTPVYEAMMTDATGAAIGIFRAVGPTERMFDREQREAIAVAASLANVALNQRRLFERLNFTSTHDPLTGLPNRRLSDERLEEALRDAKVSGDLVSVIYIDVDHFKQVNDLYGHKTGDLYLRAIAERLNGKTRSTDLLARIGGDEFLLTASLRNLADAEMYRVRLQSCFEERFRLEGIVVDGSASIGLAVFPVHGGSAEELQRHADLDMYAAKQRRHQVVRPIRVETEQRLVS